MSTTDPSSPTPVPHSANVVALPAKTPEPTPSEKVVEFVKRHPAVAIAGGIAVGVAVSALLPRFARRRSTSRKLTHRAVELVEAASAAGVLLGRRAGDTAHDLQVDAGKHASRFADRAEKAGDLAMLKLEKYGLAAVATASALGRATARRASRLGDTAAESATQLGDAAAARSAKALQRAEDMKKRIKV